MPIDIGDILRRGYERTVAPNGLRFVAILYVISVLDAMFSPDVEQAAGPVGEMAPPELGPVIDAAGPPISLGLAPVVAMLLSLVLGLVSVVVTIAALRTFVSEQTATLPREHFTENVLWPAVNLIVGGIVFGIAVALGLVLLIVPGLFILVSLIFWEIFVAVEDDNFVEGFQHSWALTRGHRLKLFGLGVVAILAALVVSVVFAIPGVFLPAVVGFLIETAGAALVGVFLLASLAATYNQLVADGAEAAE